MGNPFGTKRKKSWGLLELQEEYNEKDGFYFGSSHLVEIEAFSFLKSHVKRTPHLIKSTYIVAKCPKVDNLPQLE